MKAFILSCVVYAIVASGIVSANPWPAWRGDALGSGIATETGIPVEWGKEKNIRWRVPLPDRGNSTPVVWGDRIFVTQAVESENFRGLLCLDRKDGSVLWKKGVTYKKPERTHRSNPYCSPSAVTDGKRVVAAYGSAGVHCYDIDGNTVWSRDFGPQDHVWGHAASPVLTENLCFYYHGPGKGSRLYALDLKTGETIWEYREPDWKPGKRTDGFQGRDDEGIIGSFSTPILANVDGRDELIMSFPMEIAAFDPGSGKKLWTCEGLNPLVYTSPTIHEGVVVAMGGYRGNSVGVKAGGDGDVTESSRLWQEIRHNGGIGTGVAKDGYLYYQNSGGIAYCLEMKSGKTLWEARLPGKGGSWGSFVLAGEHIYSLSQAGSTVVFEASPEEFRQVAVNDLGETTNSSLAVSDGEIFLRTHEALWCVGRKR